MTEILPTATIAMKPHPQKNICKKCALLPAILLVFACLCTTATHRNNNIVTVSTLTNYFLENNTNATETQYSSPSDHSPLLPLQPSDIWGFTFASLGLILASGGGIGGGGMLVPIYILVMGFLPKHAIPLSNVTVFGGAVANYWGNWGKRHPLADRPLIDWDLILVMEPPTLFGALVGANLNKVLSETIIAVMLVLLLSFTAQNTFKKAIKMYRVESLELHGPRNEPLLNQYVALDQNFDKANNNLQEADDEPFEYEEFCLNRPNSGTTAGSNLHPIQPDAPELDFYDPASQDDHDSTTREFDNPLLLEAIIEQERHVKPRSASLIVFMFLVVIVVNVLKGGGGFPSPLGINCGSLAFWTVQLLLLVFIGVIAFVARRRLIKDTQRKMDAGYIYLKEDIRWDERSTVVFPLVSSVAGFCAGMFGIGGGIVKGPLMLAMGVHPAVASATSACMILFTSLTATTTFAVYGMLVKDYAIVCLFLGLISTAFGQKVMSRMVKKTKRNSYIAFSIGVAVLLSALLMTLESILHMMSDKADEEFSGICAAHLNEPHL